MKKSQIIEELDKLKLKIMIDGIQPEKSELEEYQEWLNEIIGKKYNFCKYLFYPEEYTKIKMTNDLVLDLIYKKYCDKYEYHKNKREINQIIKDALFMREFIKTKIKGE